MQSVTHRLQYVKELMKVDAFIPKKADKEVISIRIPLELLETVDRSAAKADISRNEFINQCILFTLRHMEE